MKFGNDRIISTAEQGTEEWLAVRRGRITASRAKDAAERVKSGAFGSKAALYARDVARERCGGMVWRDFDSKPMKAGRVEEEAARMAYEAATGLLVDQVGFIYTPDGWFGCSPDGLVDPNGGVQIKTMVGSMNLFSAMVYGDISEFIDQVDFEMWICKLDWMDLVLWAPDLPVPAKLRIIRVPRDDQRMGQLTVKLTQFKAQVMGFESDLRQYINTTTVEPAPPPAEVQGMPGDEAPNTTEIPQSLF